MVQGLPEKQSINSSWDPWSAASCVHIDQQADTDEELCASPTKSRPDNENINDQSKAQVAVLSVDKSHSEVHHPWHEDLTRLHARLATD